MMNLHYQKGESLELTQTQAKQWGNTDPVFKHQCTVRQLILYRRTWGLVTFRKYIIKTKFSQQVWDDYAEQYKLGNTGQKGEWKCQPGSLF